MIKLQFAKYVQTFINFPTQIVHHIKSDLSCKSFTEWNIARGHFEKKGDITLHIAACLSSNSVIFSGSSNSSIIHFITTSSGKSSPNFMYGSSAESSGWRCTWEGDTGAGECGGRGEFKERGDPVWVRVSGGIWRGWELGAGYRSGTFYC